MEVKVRQGTIDDAGFLSWVILFSGRSHTGISLWDIAITGNDKEKLLFLRSLITQAPNIFVTMHFSQ